MFSYQCPACRTSMEFRNRVTVRQRKCPQCGHPVSIQEIDRQVEAARAAAARGAMGCLIVTGIGILFLVVVGRMNPPTENKAADKIESSVAPNAAPSGLPKDSLPSRNERTERSETDPTRKKPKEPAASKPEVTSDLPPASSDKDTPTKRRTTKPTEPEKPPVAKGSAENKHDPAREDLAKKKLKLAKQLIQDKQDNDAREVLIDLVRRYPGTEAAAEAAKLLEGK